MAFFILLWFSCLPVGAATYSYSAVTDICGAGGLTVNMVVGDTLRISDTQTTCYFVTNSLASMGTFQWIPSGSDFIAEVIVTSSGIGTKTTTFNGGKILTTIVVAAPAAPTVTALAPASGPAEGGTSVTITGTGFTDATSVKFGATNATSFTVVSSTQITAVSPAGAIGTVNVTVTNPNGPSSTLVANQFTYAGSRQVGPINAAAGGGTVSVRIASGSAGCVFDLPNTTTFSPPSYSGVLPPLGGLRLKVTGCTVGETIQLAVTFSNLNGMTARKYGVTPTSGGASVWYSPAGLSISDNTITYSVTDNGLGDDTFTGADGIINDPIIPLPQSAFTSASIPTLSEWAMIILVTVITGFTFLTLRRKFHPKA